jgi:protein-S-isoprenylcysteine O-methyltransferase Ste14
MSQERGPDVIAPPPLIFVVPLLGGLVLDRIAPLPRLPRPPRWPGLPLVASGLALGGWFFTAMRKARTPVDPYHPPTALVTEGPFGFTRNPGYVGLTLCYAGTSLLAGARWPLLFLPGVLAAIDAGVIRREERYLEKRFGSRYGDYRSRVRRWL